MNNKIIQKKRNEIIVTDFIHWNVLFSDGTANAERGI
jgi:hypothetical protein